MLTELSWLCRLLKPCLNCGSLYCETPPLCRACFASLKRFEGAPLHGDSEALFPAYSLYDWQPGESDTLSSLFLSLKGSGGKHHWPQFASLFVGRRLSLTLQSRPIIVVPAPSSNGKEDHAYLWGRALAHHLQAEFYPCLRKDKRHHQRGANREQRLRARLRIDEKYTSLSKNSTEALWVFADDILTTGATAHAAYEALGSPPHFEAWTLGRRSLSCGASTYLL